MMGTRHRGARDYGAHGRCFGRRLRGDGADVGGDERRMWQRLDEGRLRAILQGFLGSAWAQRDDGRKRAVAD
jgi:hypothetical protein